MTSVVTPSQDGRTSRVSAAVVSILDGLLLFLEQRRQRHDLLRLDDHMLRDIGITRAEAVTEAELFWPRR